MSAGIDPALDGGAENSSNQPGGPKLSVVIAGGGTAGHIEPALAVADALRARSTAITVTALGTTRGLEGELVPARGYELRLIPAVPLPRKPSLDLLRLPGRVLGAVNQTRRHLRETNADVVIGFGGYVSVPAYIAARLARPRIPVVVHEANARAGIANRLGAKVAAQVLAAVPGSGLAAQVVGIPVRPEIAQLDRAALRDQARAHFGLPASGPVVLVTGGSQGAQSLNTAFAGAAAALQRAGVSVLHAVGKKNLVEIEELGLAGVYRAVPYISEMPLALAAADLAVCRAGAMTVAEISAVGLPAVYVPLPHGNGEQALNAEPVVAAGGGVIVPDAQFTAEYVTEQVLPLALDAGRLAEMGRAARSSGSARAAERIADIVVSVAGR